MLIEQRRQQWEYSIVTLAYTDGEGFERWIKMMGEEGWQLVTVVGKQWVFMRPKLEEGEPWPLPTA